jgi:hypothetical protein
MPGLPRTWKEIAFHHAVHETGHAVVAWIMTREHNATEDHRHQQEELGFSRVLVRSLEAAARIPSHDVGSVKRVQPYGFLRRYVPGDEAMPVTVREREHRRMEREITIALAGPVAEARYRHKNLRHLASADSGCRSDFVHILNWASDFSKSEEDREELIAHLFKRTREILRSPRVRPTVLGLAKALRARHERMNLTAKRRYSLCASFGAGIGLSATTRRSISADGGRRLKVLPLCCREHARLSSPS